MRTIPLVPRSPAGDTSFICPALTLQAAGATRTQRAAAVVQLPASPPGDRPSAQLGACAAKRRGAHAPALSTPQPLPRSSPPPTPQAKTHHPLPCHIIPLQKLAMPALSPTMTQGNIAKWYVIAQPVPTLLCLLLAMR